MDKQKKNYSFFAGIVFLVLFAIFTVIVKTVDVAPKGPEGSKIGLWNLNRAFYLVTDYNRVWYRLTQGIGYIAILTAVVFGVVGAVQLIRRKSIKKVDISLLILASTYGLMAGFYVLFEALVINYRPMILDPAEGLEASYPSSHTMLVIVVMMTAVYQIREKIHNLKLAWMLELACAVCVVLMIVGRLYSGVHWFTDIVGGVLLGFGIAYLYAGIMTIIHSKKTTI